VNGKLEEVKKMIKKTFHTKDQEDCFDGCVMYTDELCSSSSRVYIEKIDRRFDEMISTQNSIITKLDELRNDLGYQNDR
jgi:hypothetical protein